MDIILDILEKMRAARPDAVFIESLYNQYCQRGGLSRKQLEGLYSKVSKVPEIPASRLATLEAIIKKKPVRQKSEKIVSIKSPETDTAIPSAIDAILEKYPQHKRVLYLQSVFKKEGLLSLSDQTELERFTRLLLK